MRVLDIEAFCNVQVGATGSLRACCSNSELVMLLLHINMAAACMCMGAKIKSLLQKVRSEPLGTVHMGCASIFWRLIVNFTLKVASQALLSKIDSLCGVLQLPQYMHTHLGNVLTLDLRIRARI